jgi:DNA-binding transcriptional LysR family regulator
MSENSRTTSFHLAASYTIGSYILPGELTDNINEILNGKLRLTILPCDEIISGIKKGIFDLGLIESPLFDEKLVYKEWMEDEMVICSQEPLSDSLEKEELSRCKLICRKEGTLTRNFITNFLADLDLSYKSFNSLSEVDNATAMIQSIKWTKPNQKNQTIAIVSKLAIEDELKYNKLYISRICNKPMLRNFHLIYDKEKISNNDLNKIISNLLEKSSTIN